MILPRKKMCTKIRTPRGDGAGRRGIGYAIKKIKIFVIAYLINTYICNLIFKTQYNEQRNS
jgi:hypothetical protein